MSRLSYETSFCVLIFLYEIFVILEFVNNFLSSTIAFVFRRYPANKDKIKSLYIRSKLPFPETEKFIQISGDR